VADITPAALAAHLASIGDPDEVNKYLRQARMLAAAQADAGVFEPPIRTLADYLAAPIEVPPVLIHPIMCVRGGLNVTVGRAGKGKTVMNLNRMLRWSAGLPMFDDWHDHEGNPLLYPDQPLKVLIVENEGAAGMFHRQIGLMLNCSEYLDDKARGLAQENTLIWGEGGYSHLKLDDPQRLQQLRAGIEKWKPDMVFIEPFRSLWSGEENSSTEMNVVVDALVGIAVDFDCGVWAAHHEKKGGHGEDDKMSAARGSSVLEGIVTLMEHFESAKGGDQRELLWSKSRYEVPPPPVRMEWDHEAKWYNYVPASDLEDRLIAALMENADEPMTVRELSEATDEPQTRIRKPLKALVDDAKLKKMGSVSTAEGSTGARYRLPSRDNDGGGLDI
jgi:hypothetical protein